MRAGWATSCWRACSHKQRVVCDWWTLGLDIDDQLDAAIQEKTSLGACTHGRGGRVSHMSVSDMSSSCAAASALRNWPREAVAATGRQRCRCRGRRTYP